MDNQQGRLVLCSLSWLGGIIDGEGCITLRRKNRYKKQLLVTPTFSVVNTNKKIIDKVVEILKEYNFSHWVHYDDNTNDPQWKPKWEIQITGIKRISKFLPTIIPYLVGKQETAQLVLEWCLSRLSKLGKSEEYTIEEWQLFNKIKLLHNHQDQIILEPSTTNTLNIER